MTYLPKEQSEESGYEAHREQTTRGLVRGHSTFSGLFFQDVGQLVVLAEQLYNFLKAAFTVTDGGKQVTKILMLQQSILTTQEDMLSPVVSFSEVPLQKDLIHSHHQHSIDVIFHSNTWHHGVLSWLILTVKKKGNNIKKQVHLQLQPKGAVIFRSEETAQSIYMVSVLTAVTLLQIGHLFSFISQSVL